MQCNSCQAEIPPSWVHAINNNTCPGCGGTLMDEMAKQLLDELKEAMGKMSGSPEALAGWLLSTYHLKKKGEKVEPVVFYEKGVGNSSDIIKVHPNNMLERFKKIAEQNPSEKNSKTLEMIALVNDINQQQEAEQEPEVDTGLTTEETKYLLTKAAQQKGGTLTYQEANRILNQGTELYLEPDAQPLSPQEQAVLSQLVETTGGTGNSQVQAFLEKDRIDRLQKQREFQLGGKSFKTKKL